MESQLTCPNTLAIIYLIKGKFYNYQPQPKYSWALSMMKGEIKTQVEFIICTKLNFFHFEDLIFLKI